MNKIDAKIMMLCRRLLIGVLFMFLMIIISVTTTIVEGRNNTVIKSLEDESKNATDDVNEDEKDSAEIDSDMGIVYDAIDASQSSDLLDEDEYISGKPCDTYADTEDLSTESIQENSIAIDNVVTSEEIDSLTIPDGSLSDSELCTDESLVEELVGATQYKEGSWTYSVNSNEATVIGYSGNSGMVTIPTKLGGYYVTEIGHRAFEGKSISGVTIPEKIEAIGSRAFADCKYLTTINYNARNCKAYYFRSTMDSHVFVNAGKFSNSLTVTFGSSVEIIPACLFEAPSDCYAHVTKVVISDSVKIIDEWAFKDCYDLQQLKIGNAVERIKSEAFANCYNIKSLTIPKKVEYIGLRAFSNLKSLNTLNFNAVDCNIYYFRSQMDYHAFINAGKISGSLTVTFGEGVKVIPCSMFEAYDTMYARVTSVIIPSSVTEIEPFAFNNCKDLTTVKITSSKTVFPTGYDNAFDGCKSNLVFKCYEGSTADRYARKQGFKVSYLKKSTNKKSISNASISGINPTYGYTGKAHTPTLTVKLNGVILKKDKDYTVKYANNKNPGTATITINGIGNYTGTKFCTFQIIEIIPVYRLFNTRTGEHFYTASTSERQKYLNAGNWNAEGVAWYAPKTSSEPIYRLSNPNNGNEHHYTKSKSEKNWLVGLGWKYDCIAWYSDTNKTVPIYRHYHPIQRTGNHHYTTSKGESDHIVKYEGWKYEGIAFYVSKAGG